MNKQQKAQAAERAELVEVLSGNIARAVIAGRELLTTKDGPYYLVFATMQRMVGPYAAEQADKILMAEMRSGTLVPLTAKNAPFVIALNEAETTPAPVTVLPVGCLFDGLHGYVATANRVVALAKEMGLIWPVDYSGEPANLGADDQFAAEYLAKFAPVGHWVGYQDGDFGVWEDEEDNSCNQCEAAMINGVYCHEHGCPNRNKVKVDGEWVAEENDDDDNGLYDDYDYSNDETND